MIFKDPWILFLIPLVVFGLWFLKRRQPVESLRFPSAELVAGVGQTWKTRLIHLPFLLRLIAVTLMLIALAGPHLVLQETTHKSEGIDIVLAIDASGSMRAEDFTINGVGRSPTRINRLEVVKRVVNDFIDGRQNDRLGLVAFGGLAYVVSPLTTDYAWLKQNLERVKLGLIEDGTAIGSAITSSIARLRHSKAKSKVIIVLTDGINNAGKIDPISAAQAAKALGIKIDTIGAGTKGYAPFPTDFFGRTVYQQVRIDIDEDTLKKIAEITGGKYFRATDTSSLQQIYKEIDRLEKTEIETLNYKEYKELFVWFLMAALGILFLELLLSNTFFLRIP